MAKYDMSEALCALPNGVIEMRRCSLAMPLGIFFLGVVLFVINGMIEGGNDSANLKSAIVLFGAVLALVGGAMSVIRLSGGGMAPWHTKEKVFLKKEELRFNKEDKLTVVNLVERQDFTNLRQLKQANISAVIVTIWSTPSGDFSAAQVFEYVELELQPVSKLAVKA
ncbi:MAG: hypothetical protein IKM03_08410 [Alistipes sp.]|nr:hypothetical protein [Alistipes sp.]